jgi:outer membrane protein OmpA-like peptidoglycan-associated protein
MSSWVFDYNEPSCNTLQETPNVTLVEANPVNITTAVENEIPTYKFIESAFLFQKNSSKVDLNNFDKNILTENQVEKIIITGNTCQLGSYPYNYNLGFKRANAVSDYLNSIGINKNKLIIKSDGEKNPISKNLSKNRRVDLNIIFNTK